MVMLIDLAIMIGLPVVLFIVHRLWREAVERQKNGILLGLLTWFAYTFFGSQIVRGEPMIMVVYSAVIVAVLAAGMVVILKQFPDQAAKYSQQIRFGFMAAAAAAMIVGWTAGGF